MKHKKPPYVVRPRTAVLTRGFDPRLSVGSARPAVFRSSTYVFSSPESAERSFAIALGRFGVLKPDVPVATTAIARPAADARSASRRAVKALRPGLAGII